jgi:hypothetical protein
MFSATDPIKYINIGETRKTRKMSITILPQRVLSGEINKCKSTTEYITEEKTKKSVARTTVDPDPISFDTIKDPAYYVEKDGVRHCFNGKSLITLRERLNGKWSPLNVTIGSHKDFENIEERLFKALLSLETKTVQFLIDLGADPSKPLHRIIKTGKSEAVKMAINAGANSGEGWPGCMHQAAQLTRDTTSIKEIRAIIKMLLKYGADINEPSVYFRDNRVMGTPIFGATDDEVVKILIENGASINAQNRMGYTVLHQAALDFNQPVLLQLLKQGADFNAKSKNETYNGFTVMDFLAMKWPLYAPDVFKFIEPSHFFEKVTEALKAIAELNRIQKSKFLFSLWTFFKGQNRKLIHTRDRKEIMFSCALHTIILREYIMSLKNQDEQINALRRLDEINPVCQEDECNAILEFIENESANFSFYFDTTVTKMVNIANCANAIRNMYCRELQEKKINPGTFKERMRLIGQKVNQLVRGKKASNGTVTYDDVAIFIDTHGVDLLSCSFPFDDNFFEGFKFIRVAQGV